jgi:DNA recombination protein RmuC
MLAAALSVVSGLLCVVVFVLWRAKEAAEGRERALIAQLSDAQKNEALATQRTEAVELRLKDFEILKVQFETYAKSAALETGNQLSNKLLTDHQRAREETHKQFEQFTKTATEQLMTRQQELAAALSKVQGQMDTSTGQINTLVRAMKNPIGAGAEGEVALNNLLQQLGLTAGVDYDLQLHLAGEVSNLRPDGVVYLPAGQALIIDAKASQHIFALYEADGTPEFNSVFERVRATMKQHVKALAGKAYREEVTKLLRAKDRAPSRVMLVMFVPNDEVVTRLRRADAELMALMAQAEIILAGPATLPALFLYASTLIREARQADAQAEIMELTAELMADLITAMDYAEDVIKGIRSSATAYDKFAGSLNKGVMARLKRLGSKGVKPARNKQLPSNLPRYSVHREDDVLTMEADENPAILSLPKDSAA